MNETRDEWMARFDRQDRVMRAALATMFTMLGGLLVVVSIVNGVWPLFLPLPPIFWFWWWYLGRNR